MEAYNKQIWYCPSCNKHGTVTYKKHADILSVAHLLTDHHKAISPNCQGGGYELKAVKDEKTLKGLTKKLLVN